MTIFHVNQASDTTLRTLVDEVLDQENRAVVAVTGPQGAGKTQRLLLAAAEAKERHAFAVYFDVTTQSPWALRGLAGAFEKAARDAKLVKMLGSPSWLRSLAPLAKPRSDTYDPKDAGRRIGEALNATSPSFLLLNDLHNLADSREVDLFAKTLEEITAVIKPGVLLMFTCYASYLAWLKANQPVLVSRVNRTIALAILSDDEARLVIAKKLLAKRIVEDLEPTYPFDRSAVQELNRSAHGNPRRLFELADVALEWGVSTRAYQIDEELVRTAISARDTVPTGPAPTWQETSEAGEPAAGPAGTARSAPVAKPARRSIWGKSH